MRVDLPVIGYRLRFSVLFSRRLQVRCILPKHLRVAQLCLRVWPEGLRQGQNKNATAHGECCCINQKLCQASAACACLAWSWSFRFQRILLLLLHRSLELRASGADDLVGGTEDLLGAPFRDRRRVKTDSSIEPVLDIASAIVPSCEA